VGNARLKGLAWDASRGVPTASAATYDAFVGKLYDWYQRSAPQMVKGDVSLAGLDLANAADIIAAASAMTQDLPATAVKELETIAAQYTRDALDHGAAFAIAQMPDPVDPSQMFNQGNPRAEKFVHARGLELAKSVPETLKTSVQSGIADLLKGGTTPGEVADAITAAAPDLTGYQAERLARTELSFANGRGTLEQYLEMGVEARYWVLGSDPCPICAEFADKYGTEETAVPVGQPFIAAGMALDSYPAHPNCNCATIPVVTKGGGS
jgi:hypothetical protein